MAAEVPDEFNLFGTPLTESDFIINESKLVINENLDYSVMVKCETMDFTPCNVEQVVCPILMFITACDIYIKSENECRLYILLYYELKFNRNNLFMFKHIFSIKNLKHK